MDYRKKLGKWGEDQAVRLLQKKGYEILERNYHTRYGEIDIIARQEDCLVFVEVKTRQFDEPTEAINKRKQQKMLATAQHYAVNQDYEVGDIRFDCVALQKSASGYKIRHFQDIIEAI